jgi:hypothetical protein
MVTQYGYEICAGRPRSRNLLRGSGQAFCLLYTVHDVSGWWARDSVVVKPLC